MDAGAVQVTTADWFPGIAVTAVGAPGVVEGVAAAEGVEELPVPEALVAVTVKVKVVPLVRPVTVQESAAVAHVWPLLEVTV